MKKSYLNKNRNSFRARSTKFLTSALLGGMLVGTASAQISSYKNSSTNGVWTLPLNWSTGVPNGAGHTAFIGPAATAENSKVTMNTNVSLDGLLITDGMHLDMAGRELGVTGSIPASGLSVIGMNMVDDNERYSQIIIRPVAGNEIADIFFKDAAFEQGAKLVFAEVGSRAWVTGQVTTDADSAIEGFGSIFLTAANDPIDNNGTIRPGANQTLLIQQNNILASLNLDGSNRSGRLDASATNSKIVVDGALTGGAFDGDMEIGAGSDIEFKEGVTFGMNQAATVAFDSPWPQTGILKVGDDETVWLRLDSTMASAGSAVIDGNFKITGLTEVNVASGILSQLRVTGNSELLGGIFDISGTMNFDGGVSDSSSVGFVLNGGEVKAPAGTIINLSGDEFVDRLSGHGLWKAGIRNDTVIQANGGKLTVDATGHPADFDGADNLGKLRAGNGDLCLKQTGVPNSFRSKAVVSNGHKLSIDLAAWTFTETSQLTMGGDEEGGAIEATGDLTFAGAMTVALDSEILSSATFAAGSSTSIKSSTLKLKGGSQFNVEQGAAFTDNSGTLRVDAGNSLNFSPTNNVGTELDIAGTLGINGSLSGYLSVDEAVTIGGTASVDMDIKGIAKSLAHDRIQVNSTLTLGGRLKVTFDHPDAQIGEIWQLLRADTIEGQFANFIYSGTPAGTGLVLFTADDRVHVKLVPLSLSYLDWANQQGLMLADLGKFQDPDKDGMNNALEMLVGGDPLAHDPYMGPTVKIVTDGGVEYLAITFYEFAHAVTSGLDMEIQMSPDLAGWEDAMAVEFETIHNPFTCRYLRTFRSPVPVTEAGRQFLRLAFP